ncbi:hypothetical protein SDC9_119929 [bioreactor metagenome]|uniref:Uncharacterized protein n=1 Tax=bioreactor metagenome TaxID=1076179 RepID=A0A645C900_9ZZZZ
MKIISALFVPIVFLLDFNIAFVLTGFFAFIVYGLIFVSVFNLIGALIRKFRIYAIIFFIAVGTALIINLTWSIKAFSNIFGFLFSEKSIAVFFLKGIVLFIIINALSFVINYNTVYYKSNKNSKQLILIFSVTGLLIVVLFSLFIGILPISDSAKNEYNGNTGSENSEYLYTSKEITIDISHLKKGSIINIITNDNIIDNIDNYDSSSSRYRMFLNNPKSLEVTDGKLVVSYNFPLNTQNGKNITALTNPTFKAELKGNNLYLEYEYTRNIKAVINPVWSMIMQFKSFSDKNVYYSFFMSSESSGSGNVFVQCGEE